MALIDGVLGNASEVSKEDIQEEIDNLLISNEKIDKSYKLIRDLIIFTDKRLILVDKQGMTGKKIDYHSVPYNSISHYTIETAGNFDLDAELKIWISSAQTPTVQKRFNKKLSIYEIQKVLSRHVLK